MVFMKPPAAPIPWNNGNFGPKGYYPYLVKTNDNWENIATRDGRTFVWDLIRDNFQTDDPEEVNWYLQHYVGCTVSKDGGKNYSFDTSDAVLLSDGTKRRGRIFTKTDLQATSPPPPDDHDQLRKGMIGAISSNSGTIFSLSFSMYGFDLLGTYFRDIHEYLKTRKVGVKYDPFVGTGKAEYDSVNDLFVFATKTFSNELEVAHLVHEMTHAVCDDHSASFLTKQKSEAIAYVAQCLFIVKRGGTMVDKPPMKPIGPYDTAEQRQEKYRKFAIGTEIAQNIKSFGRVVSASDESRMLWAMKNDHEGTGMANYNGIERRLQF